MFDEVRNAELKLIDAIKDEKLPTSMAAMESLMARIIAGNFPHNKWEEVALIVSKHLCALLEALEDDVADEADHAVKH